MGRRACREHGRHGARGCGAPARVRVTYPPSMPRYEYSEGSSSKFWEINLAGKSFTTTYGKIGSKGQTTIKTFSSEAEARKEHDKLIAEKVKKGYVPVGKPKARAATAPPAAVTQAAAATQA